MSLTESDYEAGLAAIWQSDAAHDIGHLRRVWGNCQKIARAEGGGDLQILMAAAYLHDLVNLAKDAPNRHEASRLSAAAAVEWLRSRDFPAGKLAAVAHAIAAHSFSAGIAAETPEARILQDADRLEALGAIGLARLFAVAGQMGAQFYDPADPLAQRRALDDKAFALDHLEVKLFPLVEKMQTATGREIAEERAEWVAAFRSRLLREIG